MSGSTDRLRIRRHPWLRWAIVLCAIFALAAGVAVGYRMWKRAQPWYSDTFAHGGGKDLRHAGWQSFGGTWEVRDGAVLNISDDRGARLVNGESTWKNYVVEADLELLGEFGDAGFLVRTSDEEVGVDAYHGYFAGLRDTDQTLILGRADYGWHELQMSLLHTGLLPHHWYHLKFLAYECSFVAVSTTEKGEVRTAHLTEPNCLTRGRFGLQSYSTGAAWKNLSVRPASKEDLLAMQQVQNQNGEGGAGNNPDAWTDRRYDEPMQRAMQEHRAALDVTSIGSLQLLDPNRKPQVKVRGVVTMASPMLFVQDSTGGMAIHNADPQTLLKIGDTVEASGTVEQHAFSSEMQQATVRVLWSHSAIQPYAVSALQAASGAFDAQYVETEGRLVSVQHDRESGTVLHLEDSYQDFHAIVANPELAGAIRELRPGSRLRLRGISVSSPGFVPPQIPFALLMRTSEDVEVVEAPPWWNTEHILEAFAVLLLVSFFLQMAIHSVRRAQLHAVMEERERLAMEMHDTLAQSFAGLGYQLEGISREMAEGSTVRRQMETSVNLVRFGHEEARRNIAALRPGNLEQLGLAKALEQAAQAIVPGGKISVRVSAPEESPSLPLRIADTFLRIGQESIANAVRHGDPRNIHLRLLYGRSTVRLIVRDDGAGFTKETGGKGFGIRGMQRRAEGVGAQLCVRSSPGSGTIVSVRVKVPQLRLGNLGWNHLLLSRWRAWFAGKNS